MSKKKKNVKNTSTKKKTGIKKYKKLGLLLTLVLALIVGFFLYKAYGLGLPSKYFMVVAAILSIIVAIILCLLIHRRRGLRIVGLVLLILVGGGTFYGSTVMNDVHNTLKAMEENAAKKAKLSYSVLINEVYDTENGEVAPELTELSDKTFAVLEVGNTSYNRDVVEMIRKDMDQHIEFDSIKTADEAIEKMISGEIQVLVMNESVRSMVEYDLNTISTVVKTYEFEQEKEVNTNSAKVTEEPFIVYISGIDTYGDLSVNARTDVNKIAVVNPLVHEVLFIDIPRDYYVSQPCQAGQKDKLTHTGMMGIGCSIDTIADFMDIDINYYARVNFSSVIEIINALGGVSVYSEYDFCVDGFCYYRGENEMSGEKALRFARERYSLPGGDFDRIKNQTRVLEAMINKVLSPSILSNYDDLLKVVSNNVETNMSAKEMISLVKMQLSDMSGWTMDSYALEANGTYAYSPMCGQQLYQGIPVQSTIGEAKMLIDELMAKIY